MSIHSQAAGISCLPVTALQTVFFRGRKLILSGQGFYLSVHCLQSKRILLTRQVFTSQAIHGILFSNQSVTTENKKIKFLIWGGSQVCYAILSLKHSQPTEGDVFAQLDVGPSCDVGDWVLSASAGTGIAHEVVVLTAHNVLYDISDVCDSLTIRISILCKGPQSFLYSGHVLVTSSDKILVASGTVFGEIIVWSCHKSSVWLASVGKTLLGHRGSVFGVNISETRSIHSLYRRFLASCSDDRTIRIWDITSCEDESRESIAHDAVTRVTGFGDHSSDELQVAETWGHLSRIWGVYFLYPQERSDTVGINLLSRGEDGVCQLWSLKTDEQPLAITSLYSDRHHTGKNVWSLASDQHEGNITIITGGADGQIVERVLDDQNSYGKTTTHLFKNILPSADHVHAEDTVDSKAKALKTYLVLSSTQVLATTDAGGLLLGTSEQHQLLWRSIFQSHGKIPLMLAGSLDAGAVFFVDQESRKLYAYHTATQSITYVSAEIKSQVSWLHVVWNEKDGAGLDRCCILLCFFGQRDAMLIWVDELQEIYTTKQAVVQIPDAFVPTTACYDTTTHILVCGSRSGALLVYCNVGKFTDAHLPSRCIRHVHDSDSVTCVTLLESQTLQDKRAITTTHILTTGRDGTYAIHRILSSKVSENVSNLNDFCTVHRSTPSFGPNIEGAYFDLDAGNEKRLILYGFRSTNFVVWDESNQSQMLTVNCGGAHRGWAYKTGGVDTDSGTFIWTKTGSVYYHRPTPVCHKIIQHGGPGREIKALAVWSDNNRNTADSSVLLALGAEDTDIRLFRYHPGRNMNWNCISIIKKHTTGLQDLRFSRDGRFLFSSGGCEEFYVWRLHRLPGLDIGVVEVEVLPKEDEDSDARIMSIDVVDEVKDGNGDFGRFRIVAAYSNGKGKVFEYSYGPSQLDCALTLLHEYNLGALCLTQAHFIARENDGDSLSMFGATNGFVNVCLMSEKANSIIGLHSIHQSSITALSVVKIDKSKALVLTGGDDNAFGATIMQVVDPAVNDMSWQTSLIPDAHAAALTALVVLPPSNQHNSSTLVVTAGNDQRIKIWSVGISDDGNLPNETKASASLQVCLLDEMWTAVADVSGIEVVKTPSYNTVPEEGFIEYEVLVVGVGMQVLKFQVQK